MALWPEEESDAHHDDMASYLEAPGRYCQFVAYDDDGATMGFVEASVRSDYVNGAESSPVAFLEGIYVVPAYRRRGVARRLVDIVERWARERGFLELASDALLNNNESHAMHGALGFDETERVVYFRKVLGASAGEP